MKRLIFRYISIFCCALAISCTYEYEADIPSDTNIIVVDGSIVAGSISSLSVYKAKNLNGSKNAGSVNATARIECEDGTVINSVTGGYQEEGGLSYAYSLSEGTINFDTRGMDASKKYKVFIDAGEDGTFESDWLEVYEAPVIDDFSYTVKGDGNQYLDFRISAHSDSSPYFVVSYTEAWEHKSLALTAMEYLPETNKIDENYWWSPTPYPYYHCWQESPRPIVVISSASHNDNKILDAYVTTIGHTDLRLSVLYRITINVTSASKKYYEYWDNLKKVSYVDGDLFTPIPSNIEGNIHRTSGVGTVMGYLGASRAATETIYVKNNGFYRWSNDLSALLDRLQHFNRDTENPSDENQYYCPPANEWPTAYAQGDRPYRWAINPISGEPIPNLYVWVSQACFDCRYLGGNTVFPADWPNQYEQ